jgi:hypothetical protein
LTLRCTGGLEASEPAKGPPSESRLEQYLADLKRPVGDEAPSREDLMVEIRVAVDDATRVHGLMRRLVSLFDRSAVSFDRSRREIKVESEWESRGVVTVIDAIESWIDEDGGGWAMLSIGDRSYTLPAPPPLAVSH